MTAWLTHENLELLDQSLSRRWRWRFRWRWKWQLYNQWNGKREEEKVQQQQQQQRPMIDYVSFPSLPPHEHIHVPINSLISSATTTHTNHTAATSTTNNTIPPLRNDEDLVHGITMSMRIPIRMQIPMQTTIPIISTWTPMGIWTRRQHHYYPHDLHRYFLPRRNGTEG